MTSILYPVGVASLPILLLVCPLDRRGRGRHVSRLVGRIAHLNQLGVIGIQTVWLITEVATAIFVAHNLTVLVMIFVLVGWLIDDWITGGPDDDRKRKYEWAKIKLRMPKPVKLRAIERVPAPAPA